MHRPPAAALPLTAQFRAIPGRGVEGRVAERLLRLAAPSEFLALSLPREQIDKLQRAGKTVVVLVEGGKQRWRRQRGPDRRRTGAAGDRRPLRETSRAAVTRLKGMGIRVVMLTGDHAATAAAIAAEAGIDDFRAGILPGDKAARVNALKTSGKAVVAMVGDGINDAPALAAADVSFAIGAGSDAAIEAADVTLVAATSTELPTRSCFRVRRCGKSGRICSARSSTTCLASPGGTGHAQSSDRGRGNGDEFGLGGVQLTAPQALACGRQPIAGAEDSNGADCGEQPHRQV
jgi:soluble P-type ATPase